MVTVQFNVDQDPVKKYMSQREALNKKHNKPTPKLVTLEEVL